VWRRRPDLKVFVITGDGDGLSIGGNHLIHALRRNVNLTILLFNNQIYGLTKGQYSPTSEVGKITKSTPFGSLDHPFNPVSVALGAEATFVARSIDTERDHLTEIIEAAAAHQGTSFVEVYQNCNIFNDGAFAALKDDPRPTRSAWSTASRSASAPTCRGASRCRRTPGRRSSTSPTSGEENILIHDARREDPSFAFMLSRIAITPTSPTPIGVFRQVQRPVYNDPGAGTGRRRVLDAAPAVVDITFSEVVEAGPGAVRVFGPGGARADRADTVASPGDPRTLRTSIEDLGEGTYVVTYRVVSADAHPIRGAIVFSVGVPVAVGDELAALLDPGADPVAVAAAVVRGMRYAGTLLAAGLALFGIFVLRGAVATGARLHRGAVIAGVGALVASLLALPLQAAELSGLGWSAMTDLRLLGEVRGSTLGDSVAVGAVGLAVLALLPWDRPWSRWAVPAAGVLALGSFVLTGHQVSAEPRLPMVVGDLVHLGAGGGVVRRPRWAGDAAARR
jgi:methionine-rich copper-binding protein CopC